MTRATAAPPGGLAGQLGAYRRMLGAVASDVAGLVTQHGDRDAFELRDPEYIEQTLVFKVPAARALLQRYGTVPASP
jgi:hypothetical protein